MDSLIRDAESIREGLFCKCTGTTENISWNRSRLSERITADVVIGPSRIVLRELRGRVADGQLSGRADIDIQRHPQGTFKFAASNISLRRASAPFLKNRVSGNGNLVVSGRIGNTITGQLNIRADNASVDDLAVQQVRIPIDWSFSQGSKIARWRSRSAVVKIGMGHIYCETEGDYSNGLSMNSIARLENIDTSRLIAGKSFGVGIVDGEVSIQAKRAKSLEEISGRYDFSLSHTKALEMPVLNKLPQMIKLPKIGTNPKGKMAGTLFGRLSGRRGLSRRNGTLSKQSSNADEAEQRRSMVDSPSMSSRAPINPGRSMICLLWRIHR